MEPSFTVTLPITKTFIDKLKFSSMKEQLQIIDYLEKNEFT